MSRAAVLACLLAAACSGPPPGPPPDRAPARPTEADARAALRSIAAAYAGLTSYAAGVEAEVISHVEGEVDRWGVRGRLVAARPFKFRWEGEAPWKVVAVSDGETLWTYLPEIRQVRARPAREAIGRFPRPPPGTDPTPSILLLPLVVRNDAFDVLSLGARTVRMSGGDLEIVWAEDEAFGTAAPEAATRYRRGEDGWVRDIEHEVSFRLGGARGKAGDTQTAGRSRVRILVRERHDAVVVDADVPDTTFVFEVPAGVRVVEEFSKEDIARLRR